MRRGVWTAVAPPAVLAAMIGAAGGRAQDRGLQERILRPVGAPGQVLKLEPPVARAVRPEVGEEHVELINALPGMHIERTVSFTRFIDEVEQSNLALAAQRFNVPIARAEMAAARVYPDPIVQAGGAGDVSTEDQPETYAAAVSQEIVIGGKIGARVAAARAGVTASDAGLADYWRNLRANAADDFIDGVTQILIIQRKIIALQRAEQLVALNAQNLAVRRASEDNLLRARVGELEARSDLLQTEAALHQTLAGLSILIGRRAANGLVMPIGELARTPRHFALEELIARAVASRSDVAAARAAVAAAGAQYRLALANRLPDPTVSGEYQHTTATTNSLDPAPRWDSLGVQLQIAIPLSDFNRGAREAAYYTELQAERQLQAVELEAENEVRSAYQTYLLAAATTSQFGDELLDDANAVYKERLFKLEKNLVGLTDVLDAHQALNQLYLDYYEALNAQAKALVALEQAAGIWDLSF